MSHPSIWRSSGLILALVAACGEEAIPPPDDAPPVMGPPTVPVGGLNLSMAVPIDGLFLSASGDLYGAEGFRGSRIFRVQPDGSTSIFAEGLAGPIDIAEGGDGALYVTNFNNSTVSRVAADGTVSSFAQVMPFPAGIVAGESGELYVSQYGAADPNTGFGTGDSITRISPSGEVTVLSQGGDLLAPVGLDMGPDGTLYTANLHDGRVIAVAPDGTQSLLTRILSASDSLGVGHLTWGQGALYATLVNRGQIQRIDPVSGESAPVNARITSPNGIAFSPSRSALWIAQLGDIQSLRRLDLDP